MARLSAYVRDMESNLRQEDTLENDTKSPDLCQEFKCQGLNSASRPLEGCLDNTRLGA